MLAMLTAKKEVAKAQRRLEATMREVFPETHNPEADFPYLHNGTYWYHGGHMEGGKRTAARHSNAFGTVQKGFRPPATVEMNVTVEGRDNNVGGFSLVTSPPGRST